MKIIEYEEKYLENVRDLLTELEEYIVSIDKDELDQVHPEYHEKMALVDLDEINNKRYYKSMSYCLSISKGQFFKLQKDNNVEFDCNNNTYFIDVKYDSELGLKLSDEESTIL